MQPFVAAILPHQVSIANPPSSLFTKFSELALAHDQEEVQLPYAGQEQLVELLIRLQSLDIPFVAAGPGWHPAAVFQHFRAQHLVTGTIPTIVWSAPGEIELGEV